MTRNKQFSIRLVCVFLGLLMPSPSQADKLPLIPDLKRRAQPEAKNMRLVGYTDMDGRADGLQVVGQGDNYIYVGHLGSRGISVIDVADPAKPEVVAFIEAPPNAWHINIQVADNLLIAATEIDLFDPKRDFSSLRDPETAKKLAVARGIRIFDVSDPRGPKQLSFFEVNAGWGTHRNWYSGGRYVYLTSGRDGYTGNVFQIVDILDPRNPREVSFWAWPDQKITKDRTPPWTFLHAPIIAGDHAYLAYLSDEHGGAAILDISDPKKPQLVSAIETNPPFGNGHTFLPLPGRKLAVLADENVTYYCRGHLNLTWIIDVQHAERPVILSTLPTPTKGDFCNRPVRSGPHNIHENRPGSMNDEYMVYLAAFNWGVRVYDISNPFRPEEVGYYIPADPEWRMDRRPFEPEARYAGSDLISVQDVYVDQRGYLYATDYNGGLYVLEYTGPPPKGPAADPRVGHGLRAAE